MGDSITNGGGEYITAKNPFPAIISSLANVESINKGTPGDTTTNMYSRFNSDVIINSPDYVVLLGGTNDILQHISESIIESNLTSMCNNATSNGVTPIICTIPPIAIKQSETEVLNKWIVDFGTRNGICVIDIYSALLSSATRGAINPNYNYGDDIHPNQSGHYIIGDLVSCVGFNLSKFSSAYMRPIGYTYVYYYETLFNLINSFD